MMWGTTALDRRINGYLIPDATLRRIRDEAARAGVTFFDTAEGYGGGTSEIRLRQLGIPRAGGVVATKFLPTLWRWTEASFIRALRASNTRLGVTCCDVYFVHTPIHPRSPDVWVRAAARDQARTDDRTRRLEFRRRIDPRRARRRAEARNTSRRESDHVQPAGFGRTIG